MDSTNRGTYGPASKPRRIKLSLSPRAAKYADQTAPTEVRRKAALGALPLEPRDLVHMLFALAHDPDPEVGKAACHSLNDLPGEILTAVLAGPAHPSLLGYLAHIHQEDEGTCRALALHAQTDDGTLAFLASLPHRDVVDIVSQQRDRLLECDEIVEALGNNPLTGRAVIERIQLLVGHPSGAEEAWPEDEWSEDQVTKAVLCMLGSDQPELARALASEREPENDTDQRSLFAALQDMSVLQKVKLARIGGKEARGLLIRDRNKVIASSVLASPKITESEIASIAQSRVVDEDILRIISHHRDWTQSYSVKLALCTNPKTPRPQAAKFLNYLRERDLRMLMKSRDVPAAISAHAKRILAKKGKS